MVLLPAGPASFDAKGTRGQIKLMKHAQFLKRRGTMVAFLGLL